MTRVSSPLPKIAYVFGDLSFGGSNIQAIKTIQFSGARDNCVVVSLSDEPNNSIEGMVQGLGLKLVRLHLSKKRLFFQGPKLLKKVLIDENCSVVHSNGLVSDLISYNATKTTSIKHVITLHNYLKEDSVTRMNFLKSKIAVRIQKHVLFRAKYIIACSKTLANQMTRDYPKLHITTIENGVDTRLFCVMDKLSLRLKFGIPNNVTVFITTGSLTPRKRIDETIEAFVSVYKHKNSVLLVVGGGLLLKELQEKYSRFSNVRFLGLRNDVVELLNVSDVFVSSSSSEGLPLGVLESLSIGKHVILSDIPQHLEIVSSVGFGSTYHLGNIQELSKEMVLAMDNALCCDKCLIENTIFDIRVMGARYRDYYCSLK